MACSAEGVFTFDAAKESEVLAAISKPTRSTPAPQGHMASVTEEDWQIESASEAEATTMANVLGKEVAQGFTWPP